MARTDADEHALRGRGIKLANRHMKALGTYYDLVPKAVLAAIAVDLLREKYMPGIELKLPDPDAQAAVLAEWVALHRAGVVPQEPLPIPPKEGATP